MGELYQLSFPNGKSYIGITSLTAEHRFKGHRKAARLGDRRCPLYSAWAKHGEPTLSVLAILENCELAASEIRAIRVLGTLAPNGYNVSEGGELTPMRHPDVRAKLSDAMHRKWADPQKARAFREGMKGNSNRKGQPNSAEHNAKVSAALKGKEFSESHKAALRAGWLKRKARGLGTPWNKKEAS